MSLPTVQRLPIAGAALELWSHEAGAATWDAALWGSGEWSTQDWRDVTCQVTAARTAWGANRALGILSIAAGGAWSVETYDPQRILDPANTASPFAGAVRPGALMRLRYGALILATAQLDEIDYSIRAGEGRIQGTDAVGLLLNVEVTAPASPATTLRAYARQLVALTGYTNVTVEANPATGDPTVGTPDTPLTGTIGVWESIATVAQDVLHYAWIGADGVMRFRSHGEPRDAGLILGFDGVPALDLITHSNADGIINRVIAKDTTGGALTVDDQESIRTFGLHLLDRGARKVPGAAAWQARVLDDRRLASLEYLPVQVWPVTVQHLTDLAAMQGIDLVRIRLDVPEPDVSVDVRSLGLQLDATPEGWAASVLGYVSSTEWTSGGTTPPIEPPPVATQTVVRVYTATKAARISLTDTGAKYGAGAQDQVPIGSWTGWQNRMLVEFGVDLSDAVEIVSAVLRLKTSTQVYVGFGSSPKIRINRATASWSEGSATTPGSGNAVVWPGPSYTATGQIAANISGSQNVLQNFGIDAIVRAWAPAPAGGGAVNRGLVITSYTETADKYTTEVYSDDAASAGDRPQLTVTLKIPA